MAFDPRQRRPSLVHYPSLAENDRIRRQYGGVQATTPMDRGTLAPDLTPGMLGRPPLASPVAAPSALPPEGEQPFSLFGAPPTLPQVPNVNPPASVIAPPAAEVAPSENAQQRWQGGMKPGNQRMYSLMTGRIDARATSSPRNYDPNDGERAWASRFKPQMPTSFANNVPARNTNYTPGGGTVSQWSPY